MTTGRPANEPSRSAAPAKGRRPPAELIVVVVLTYIAGFLAIGLGILFILLRYVVDNGMFGGSFGVTLIGAVVILLGLFVIALASALRRGKHYARVLTTIAMAAEGPARQPHAALCRRHRTSCGVRVARTLAREVDQVAVAHGQCRGCPDSGGATGSGIASRIPFRGCAAGQHRGSRL